MRENNLTPYDYVKAGGVSALINFSFKCIPDLIFIHKINDSVNGHKSMNSSYWQANKGAIAWDFMYRLLVGFSTFPLQRIIEQ